MNPKGEFVVVGAKREMKNMFDSRRNWGKKGDFGLRNIMSLGIVIESSRIR